MIREEKQTLRARMKAILMAFSEKSPASARIGERLSGANFWKEAGVVYGFSPLKSEPDWRAAAESQGKVIAFPRAVAAGMEFYAGTEFLVGPHGTLEPVGEAPAPPPDLVLVPGLAFDSTGLRLGRGGGYYDRFLESVAARRPVLCGICFACQVVPAIPSEPHDIRMDFVLTEAGLLDCRGAEISAARRPNVAS